MSGVPSNLPSQMATTRVSLLNELQIIWDEVGESEYEKDRMLLELEQECPEVFRRKVDQANTNRAHLRQEIADAEAELAAICSLMGERPGHIRKSDQSTGSLKAELQAILPQLEEMKMRKSDRRSQFIEVKEQIQSIKREIYSGHSTLNDTAVDETDLSMRNLEELHRELQALQKEKSERQKQVMERLSYLYSYCSVLSMDFKQVVNEIHPSLVEPEGPKSISNVTIEQLGTAIRRLREVKVLRMQQLQDLATSLLDLWNLVDTPVEEQQTFQKVTCNIAASEDEITEPDINHVKPEVSSKMKELVLKKKAELEDFCRKTHLIPESNSSIDLAVEAVESGAVEASCVLEQIELQISRVKEEALSRKDILEKVEEWMSACVEESWLEQYNGDENRYNAGRGAHLTLKRAEKARALVNKLPAMVDKLDSKTAVWENEKGIYFTYDGVRLRSVLKDYRVLRQQKELERKRQRDQGQLQTEQGALYGSKPSPRLSRGGGPSYGKLSRGRPMLQTPKPDMPPLPPLPPLSKVTPNTSNAKAGKRIQDQDCDQDCLRDDAFAALSSGRRGLDSAGCPVKQNSLYLQNVREMESPMMQKPFSPIQQNSLNLNPCSPRKVASTPLEPKPIYSSDDLKESVVKGCLEFFNTATREQLKRMKGIAEKTAQSILDAREESLFKNLEDVENAGLTDKQVRRIIAQLIAGLFSNR